MSGGSDDAGFDRDAYAHEYAPPGSELATAWRAKTPTPAEIESTFLDELCESAGWPWFVANCDLYTEAAAKQPVEDRRRTLGVLAGRSLEAAEAATTGPLLRRFDEYLAEVARLIEGVLSASPRGETDEYLLRGLLCVTALRHGDATLAQVALRPDEELKCPTPGCEELDHAKCDKCGEYLTPYDCHARWVR